MQAHADWGDNDITDIIDNVKNIKTTVQGNVATTANDLKRQLDDLKARGVHITASVEEILVWLDQRRDRFQAFKGNKCGAGSPCADFRQRLKRFAGEFSNLVDRFPAIEKVGLGNGEFGEGVMSARACTAFRCSPSRS